MVDHIISIYKINREKIVKRGYEVVGIPLTLGLFGLLFCTIYNLFLIIDVSRWFIFLETILLYLLWEVNKKVNRLLKIGWLNYEKKLKGYIAYSLQSARLSDSEQIKNLSILLKEKSAKKYKKYDLNSYLAMIVAILIFVLGLLTNESSKPLIVVVAICFIFVVIVVNSMVRTFTDLFINRESEIINELADIVDDIYFEVSIKEEALHKKIQMRG
ncbi:hypothetical protein QMK38_01030 [Lysinibacillus fusiformis]|nr:hypothetical protein [Lysinibacillus fusiformis]